MTERKKRDKRELIEGVQAALEKGGRFGWETISYGDGWTMPDANYRYRPKWYDRAETTFWRLVLATVGKLYARVYFGVRVRGRKNLKLLKKQGAITVCNHFHYVDTLFVREAAGHFRTYHTLAPWNNKAGVGGHIVRHGGTLPFSADITAMRHLSGEMQRLLKKGRLINFYPEHSMWWGYRKPRPMKDGAFRYAVKFGVPVLPMFCTFDKKKNGGIKKLTVHILPPIYPDPSVPAKAAAEQMRTAAEKSWKDCYEEAYGSPPEYLCDNN